jgi:hypothetical protein
VIGYRKVDNFDDILDFVVTEYQRVQGAVEVACDIETTCLSSWDEGAAIISISFTVRGVPMSSCSQSRIFALKGNCGPRYGLF